MMFKRFMQLKNKVPAQPPCDGRSGFDTVRGHTYISGMCWARWAASVGLVLLAGCSSGSPGPGTMEDQRLFGPVSMKLDTFSKVKDWTGDGRPDGIEALVEFDDQFGDRTKAAGTIYFELFEFRPGWPDPRGPRVANPWTASLRDVDEQRAHWERASGAYTFELAYDGVRADKDYVLTATFEAGNGTRFFSRIVLAAQPPPEKRMEPTTNPSDARQ